jgi:F-type H+-transporting ATPase subunit delta
MPRTAIGGALAAKAGGDGTLGKFLMLVADRDRLGRLPDIAQWYAKLADEAGGAGRARDHGCRQARRAARSKRSERRSVISRSARSWPRVDTDPELLGGAIVELDGPRVRRQRQDGSRAPCGAHGGLDERKHRWRPCTDKEGKKNADQGV